MTSRSKHRLHTDGPWQVAMFRDKYGATSYQVRMHTHTAIAVCKKSYWPEDHEPQTDKDGYYQPDDLMGCFPCRVANARLIAAAPELLKALEDLVRAVEENGVGGLGEMIDDAKDAIGGATSWKRV